MCVRTLFLAFALTCSALPVLSQYNRQQNFLKANSVWAFGAFAGLDFNSGGPVPIETPNLTYEGSASVADTSGNLLFHLGGWITFRGNGQLMPNSAGITPSNQTSNSAQGVLIVPVIDTPWKYYVFTNMENSSYNNNAAPPFLAYSVVDMTLDSGRGDIEPGRKNIPLEIAHPLTEAMIAIPGDNCDIWLLTHTNKYPNNPTQEEQTYFKAWHITSAGVDSTPVISPSIGEIIPAANAQAFGVGCLAVSPDRQKIALASVAGVNAGVWICRFDPATGIVSDGVRVTGKSFYGVCFSPDNTKLYTTSPNNHIYQYRIQTHDAAQIAASEYVVYQSARYMGLKLYRDTIYVCPGLEQINTGQILYPYTLNSVYVDRINNPRGNGVSCNFQFNAIRLLPGTGNITGGLPNDVVFPFIHKEQTNTIRDTICYTMSSGFTTKTLTAPAGFSFYEWDNGNTDSIRAISLPGNYWVRYYNNTCAYRIDSFFVTTSDLSFSLGDDQMVSFCDHPLSYVELKANIPNAVYRWQDGSGGNRHRATGPGSYWVEIHKDGCIASDTVRIDTLGFDLGPDIRVCAEDSIIDIHISLPVLPEGSLIRWSNGSTGSSIQANDTGLYYVQVVRPPCVFSDSVRITTISCDTMPKDTIIVECIVNIPNAFTPNGDGMNDRFLPVIEADCPVQSYLMSIYNRYGERIFLSADHTRGWDGTYKGHPAPVGSYFYDLRLKGRIADRQIYHKGDVTLIR